MSVWASWHTWFAWFFFSQRKCILLWISMHTFILQASLRDNTLWFTEIWEANFPLCFYPFTFLYSTFHCNTLSWCSWFTWGQIIKRILFLLNQNSVPKQQLWEKLHYHLDTLTDSNLPGSEFCLMLVTNLYFLQTDISVSILSAPCSTNNFLCELCSRMANSTILCRSAQNEVSLGSMGFIPRKVSARFQQKKLSLVWISPESCSWLTMWNKMVWD